MTNRTKWGLSALLAVASVAYAATTTPNMSLSIPSVGDTDYATSISNSLTLIDQHDHSSGKGVTIPTGGITNNAVTAAKIAVSVAGDGLAGGNGTALSVGVDGSTVEINSDVLRVKDAGITQAKLADRTVSSTVAAGCVAISSSSGAASTTSATLSDVTNLSVTITTTGRPVRIYLITSETDFASTYSGGLSTNRSTTNATGRFVITRDATDVAAYSLFNDNAGSGATNTSLMVPCSSLDYLDDVAAGTYTYKLRYAVETATSSATASVIRCKLVAYEI
jgi:hypothetical protein